MARAFARRRPALALVAVALLAGCAAPPGPPACGGELHARLLLPGCDVVVFHDPDFGPTPGALGHLVATTQNVTHKPAEVRSHLLAGGEAGTQDTQWDAERVHALAMGLRVEEAARDVAVRVLYLHGEYRDEDGRYLAGLAMGSIIALFPDTYGLVAPNHPLREPIERTVLVHERGHLVGLVNLRIPMTVDRLTPDGKHSRHPESVMYPAVEDARALLGTLLASEAPPDRFDAADLADIRSWQETHGKARTLRGSSESP